MRKIRIIEHISLDGVIEPGGPNEDSDYAHGGWTAPYRTPAGAAGRRRGTGQGLRSAARPPHLRSLVRLLAEGAEQSDRGRPERRDEIRRDPQAGEPRMGSGRGPGRGHHGGYSPHQVDRTALT